MSMFMKKKKTCVNCMMKLKPLVLNVSPGPSQQKAWESRCLWQPARGRPSGEQGHLWPGALPQTGEEDMRAVAGASLRGQTTLL